MTKHLQNLERLLKKMTLRYGDGDDLVLQLQQEVSSLEKKTPRDLDARKNWTLETLKRSQVPCNANNP
jgi:hypothetical protein